MRWASYDSYAATAAINLAIQDTFQLGAVDRRELFFKALAGLIGGAIGWLPVEIASHGHSLTEVQTTFTIIAGFVSMALMAGAIGGMIMAAEGQRFEMSSAAQRRFIRGFLICAAISLPATYYSDALFSSILAAGGWGVDRTGSAAYMVLARVTGWTLMGLSLGVGVGLASLSFQNVVKGGLGGLIGGFLGGLGFDSIGSLSQTGLAPRLVGFSLIGLAIGLLIGLVQELTKAAWLVVDAGRLRGRQFRLEGATISLGRAEENPVGLFGDAAVQARHAVIERRGDAYILRNLAVAAGTFVNGNRIESTELHESDRIGIGGYELGFHRRGEPRASGPIVAVAKPELKETQVVARLERADGARLLLRTGAPTRLGRALDNDIVLNDASISRYHAVIEARNGSFVVRDLGSHNGTWLAGQRVSEANLATGVDLRLGDASFTFYD